VTPLRVLIVDDEPHARAGLRALVRAHEGFAIAGEHGDGRSAAAAMVRDPPDVVLLDVQMPEMDGFAALAAAAAAGAPMPAVIFITAYDEFALEAFRVRALDYLVKPFSDARFAEALERARAAARAREQGELGRRVLALLGDVAAARGGLVVREGDRVIVVQPDELEWIEADSYYAKLHVGGRTHLLRESLTSLEGRLDPSRFARVHRSAIVNLGHVREVTRAEHGEHAIRLRGGARVPLARDRWRALVARLERR
jgi:two-component system, LytTR family, response regulator